MGKYIHKSKVNNEVAVMEVAHQSNLGVCTRARALAAAQGPSFAYLELRSRRLEKTAHVAVAGRSRDAMAAKGRSGMTMNSSSGNEDEEPPLSVEVSFGQNFADSEVRERYARETTPCSLIRDPEAIRTPGSSTRHANSSASSRRISNPTHQNIPSPHEMDNFFAGAEQIQQQIFMEKYNFDPVNDLPLPGRYEWVQLNY